MKAEREVREQTRASVNWAPAAGVSDEERGGGGGDKHGEVCTLGSVCRSALARAWQGRMLELHSCLANGQRERQWSLAWGLWCLERWSLWLSHPAVPRTAPPPWRPSFWRQPDTASVYTSVLQHACIQEKDKGGRQEQHVVIRRLSIARPSPTFLDAGARLHRLGTACSPGLSRHIRHSSSTSRPRPWQSPSTRRRPL